MRTFQHGNTAGWPRQAASMAALSIVRYDDRFMPIDRAPSTDSVQPAQRSPSIALLWLRAIRLRCPRCGRAPIFRSRFAMHDDCLACGRRFNRDAGYLLGSIYFNYGATAILVVVMYFAMFFGEILTSNGQLFVLSVFAVLFPMWFFRYARALWIAFDEHWDPWPNEEESRRMAREHHATEN